MMVWHEKRVWHPADITLDLDADTPERQELMEKLTEYSWTLCTAFVVTWPGRGSIALLNDAFSEDGALEWAVVGVRDRTAAKITGPNIESLTGSWMKPEGMLRTLRRCFDDFQAADEFNVTVSTDHASVEVREGACRLCA